MRTNPRTTTHLNLRQLRNQAKDLKKAHDRGDPTACPSLRRLFEFAGKTDEQVLASELALNKAQFALAMHYGFSSWDAMKRHVEGGGESAAASPVKSEGRVQIPGCEPLAWDSGRECTFFGTMAAALHLAGDNTPYYELMGLSGAAFKLNFATPGWDFSAVDGQLGYDHGSAACRGLGYMPIPQWSGTPNDEQARMIRSSIDIGIPALGIDLHVAPEWSVIAGYTDESKWLVRSYFEGPCGERDANRPYLESDRWPWLSFVIGPRLSRPDRGESLRAALRVAVEISATGRFESGGGGRYIGGLDAFNVWAGELRDSQRFDPADIEGLRRQGSVCQCIYDSLQDGRTAAVTFLKQYLEFLDGEHRSAVRDAAGMYQSELELIGRTRRVLPGHPDDDNPEAPWVWSEGMRADLAAALLQMREIEEQATRLFRRFLES